MTAREKLEQRLDEMYWPGYARASSTAVDKEQRVDRIDERSADDASVGPSSRQEVSPASAQPRPGEMQPSETDSGDEHKIADPRPSQPLTAREKLDQDDDASVDRQPGDAPSAPARKPVDDRPEPEDPFASYSPELRAHMLHDDTLARLQYLSPPNDEAESTSHDADAPSLIESPEEARSTSDTDLRDEGASGALPADDSSASASRLADETGDEPVADSPPSDRSPTDNEDAGTTGQEPATNSVLPDESASFETDDVAAGLDSTGMHEMAELGHEFVEDATPKEMDQYRRIREADDVDALAESSGLPREVIEEAKQHLFQRQHDVALGPGEVRHGYFTPFAEFGDLWERVASGDDLTDDQRLEFRSLLAHEYVESKLMQAGVPYKSAHPEAWTDDGMSRISREYPSAHNMAPLSAQSRPKDLLRLWDDPLGLPRGDLRVAEDLSNLDEVVRVAKKGLGL
ncbi:hypothetical protein [Kribbella sp. C-35]|uniref:hypothetical protein n=1 Tax=Kribbella sp. C-35 TaxID=2789276 RepID=UPI00397C60BF